MFGLSELAIFLIVVLVFFGAKKLPELARNAGKAARILKSESKAMKAEGSVEQQGPRIIRVQPGDRTGERPANGTTGTGNGPVRT